MQITTQGRYGLRALVDLSIHSSPEKIGIQKPAIHWDIGPVVVFLWFFQSSG